MSIYFASKKIMYFKAKSMLDKLAYIYDKNDH